MTTLEPGASVVLTHGLRCRPFSTAFLASSAAPIITDGFDVFVHDVMAAIATAPCPISNSDPSSRVTFTSLRDPLAPGAGCTVSASSFRWLGECSDPSSCEYDGASLAGNDSADASSYPF